MQGVGFRPHVYNLAQAIGLDGFTRNESDSVLTEVQGPSHLVEDFCRRVVSEAPPLARIDSIDRESVPAGEDACFRILPSEEQRERGMVIPPDVACCVDCFEELRQPGNRHYLYPFTSCTQCGPRFTINETVPYDRPNTSMAGYALCPLCAAAYRAPGDRRFHAQTLACRTCGPQVEVHDAGGVRVAGKDDWLAFCWERLFEGSILAVKGLGGFHLACRLSSGVIAELRRRKHRPYKPLAVMCRSADAVKRLCLVSEDELSVLASPQAPIVLLRKKPGAGLPENVSPGLSTVGVMLPYTPLHYLMLQGPVDAMILTSGNRSGLPLARTNLEAAGDLGHIADYFLWHDREIVQRCDDSVVQVVEGQFRPLRRSRGYVPDPIGLGFAAERPVLGMGGDMSNTFCLIQRNQAMMSQHLGEISTLEAEDAYSHALEHFMRLSGGAPSIIGYDLHPEFRVTSAAAAFDAPWRYPVQHHHAHFTSCLAEHRHQGPAVGVILDGTGYGTDGAVWGFEVISGDFSGFERRRHLKYLPLLGGESSIRRPWRMVLSYLLHAYGHQEGLGVAGSILGPGYEGQLSILASEARMLTRSVPTSSCGRLFDAVSAIIGLARENTYDGQAAIELSELVRGAGLDDFGDAYPFEAAGEEIDFSAAIRAICDDVRRSGDVPRSEDVVPIAGRFHNTVAAAVVEAATRTARETGLRTVVLSGGVWQNTYLARKVKSMLDRYTVLEQKAVPCNDGGLSLGQAAVAYWRWHDSHVSRSAHEGALARKPHYCES